jgi:hypothetical protein
MRHARIHPRLEEIQAEGIRLIDLLLRRASRTDEAPARKLIALLGKAEVLGTALAPRNFLNRAVPVARVA